MQLTVDFQYSDMSGQELRLDSRRELARRQLTSVAALTITSFRLRALSDRAQALGQNSDPDFRAGTRRVTAGDKHRDWLGWPMRASAVPVTRSEGRGKLGTKKNSAPSH